MGKDPAFLFYDGDAAKDVSHLNRLERGCYFDIIQAQRKFGRLSQSIIQKILGKDFETCWETLKICLSCEQDMYFIAWLEDSTIKRKAYSESRSKNRTSSKSAHSKPTYVNHMEIANVNRNEDAVLKGVQGENWNTKPGREYQNLELDEVKGGAVIQLFKFSKNHDLTEIELQLLWGVFKAQNFNGEKYYGSKNDAYSHFINWSKTQNVETNGKSGQQTTKRNGNNYKTAGQEVFAERLKQQLTQLTGGRATNI